MLEAAFGPLLRPFSNAAGHLFSVCIKKSAAFACARRQFLCTCVRVRISCVYVGVNMYVYAYVHVHMHARMHASPYGSEMCNSHQFDPQMWGGPIRAQKWSRCGLLCVRFLFGIEQEENRGKLLRCESPVQGTRNGRSICVCAQASCVHVHVCAHLCVYFGVCMDACKLACVYVHARMRARRVALSAVCHCCQS